MIEAGLAVIVIGGRALWLYFRRKARLEEGYEKTIKEINQFRLQASFPPLSDQEKQRLRSERLPKVWTTGETD